MLRHTSHWCEIGGAAVGHEEPCVGMLYQHQQRLAGPPDHEGFHGSPAATTSSLNPRFGSGLAEATGKQAGSACTERCQAVGVLGLGWKPVLICQQPRYSQRVAN